MRFPDGRLLVFARAPVAGQVKTRLMPHLDAAACARLQQWLIERTLLTATSAALCPADLCCTPDCAHPFFGECADRFATQARTQQGVDLGARMYFALLDALTSAEFAVLIGCDCPVLSAQYLTQACESLTEGIPVVLGPAEDGGYVLIGVRAAWPALFANISWGTSSVLGQTRERLRALDCRWRELETLWDLDRPEDLARLHSEHPEAEPAYSIGHSRQPPSISG